MMCTYGLVALVDASAREGKAGAEPRRVAGLSLAPRGTMGGTGQPDLVEASGCVAVARERHPAVAFDGLAFRGGA
jgi:hypothetical protein